MHVAPKKRDAAKEIGFFDVARSQIRLLPSLDVCLPATCAPTTRAVIYISAAPTPASPVTQQSRQPSRLPLISRSPHIVNHPLPDARLHLHYDPHPPRNGITLVLGSQPLSNPSLLLLPTSTTSFPRDERLSSCRHPRHSPAQVLRARCDPRLRRSGDFRRLLGCHRTAVECVEGEDAALECSDRTYLRSLFSSRGRKS